MRTRSVKRQKNQLELAFDLVGEGEAPTSSVGGTETRRTALDCRDPAATEFLMEEICDPGNLKRALQRVCQNQGAPGIDGMTIQALPRYLGEHWSQIRTQLLEGVTSPERPSALRSPNREAE